ncbi:MAG: glycosyltransferase family 2 protein [Anaerolineae bacterium]
MTIYAGLVTYNSRDDLPGCLAGLRAQTMPVTIIALDNASSDGSADWLRANAPEVRLIVSGENLGYGRGHNAIIRSAALQAGDYYLALNPDAALAPDYVARLVETLAARLDAGWATGKLLMDDPPRIYSAGHGLLRSGFAFNIGYGLPDDARFAESREVFGAPGAAVVYKAELIRDLSADGDFFDPAMFLYAEDSDVDWRARRQGWRCWYVAEAVAHHRGGVANSEMRIMAVSNRYLSVLKNATTYDLIAYNVPYMIAHCAVRLLITPRLGVHLAAHILRGAPAALRRRRPARIEAGTLHEWFAWSAQQPVRQRSRLMERR